MAERRLLVFLAHPDDESFGPGGTLARYADEGVAVHIVIATDGAAGSVVDAYRNSHDELAAIRTQELKKAAEILGATLHQLDYRDSGYLKDPANDHPDAFINADENEVTGRIVQLIREIRPQVVLTHDETGGYYHPDHIMCWKIATAAFAAAGEATRYPEQALPAYQPQRLYVSVFSNRWIKFGIVLMRLRRKDPTRVGRNEDIDITKLGVKPGTITTVIDYRRYWDVKRAASAEHASQGGGTGGFRRLPDWAMKRMFAKDTYIRIQPPPENGVRENDLFAGIVLDGA